MKIQLSLKEKELQEIKNIKSCIKCGSSIVFYIRNIKGSYITDEKSNIYVPNGFNNVKKVEKINDLMKMYEMAEKREILTTENIEIFCLNCGFKRIIYK